MIILQESFESKIMERVDSLQRSIEDCREECRKCREELKEKAHKNDASNRWGSRGFVASSQ